jgi:hypothetical protein
MTPTRTITTTNTRLGGLVLVVLLLGAIIGFVIGRIV